MKEGSSPLGTKVASVTFLLGLVVAGAAALVYPRTRPGTLLWVGCLGLLFDNIFLFIANTFKALSAVKGKSDAEVEDLMVPALQGEPNVVTPRVKKLCTYFAVFCLGVIMSAILLLVLRHYHILLT